MKTSIKRVVENFPFTSIEFLDKWNGESSSTVLFVNKLLLYYRGVRADKMKGDSSSQCRYIAQIIATSLLSVVLTWENSEIN